MARRVLAIALFVAAAAIVGLTLVGFILPADFAISTAIGWAFFLIRVVPNVEVNWGGVMTAVVCSTLFAFGIHWLMSWFTADRLGTLPNEGVMRTWRIRWTLCVVGVTVLMFVAGTAAVGITHQAVWLFTSDEPFSDGGLRPVANSMIVKNKLKQIGLAFTNHWTTNNRFPLGASYDESGRMMHGWQTTLLPFLEEEALFQRVHMDLPWNHVMNRGPFGTSVFAYTSPYRGLPQIDSDGLALSHFAGNAWIMSGDKRWRISDIKDGASNTLLAGESAGNYMPWGRPGNWRDPALGLNKSAAGFGSPGHDDNVKFLFADGSVRGISVKVDPRVLRAFATPNASDIIVDDY